MMTPESSAKLVVIPFTPTLCARCGHSGAWHRTKDLSCQHEIQDPANDAWMKCSCGMWK